MFGEKKGAGRIGIAVLAPGDSDDDEAGASPKDMACKAMWSALKDDDYDGFQLALDDYLRYRDKAKSAEDTDEDDASSSGLTA